MRSCVVTKEKLPKNELIRIVRTPDGNIIIDDEKGKSNGRGKDIEVINKAKKSKILERHLETTIEDDIYDKLIELVQN